MLQLNVKYFLRFSEYFFDITALWTLDLYGPIPDFTTEEEAATFFATFFSHLVLPLPQIEPKAPLLLSRRLP